jgi:hypothetical protein
VARGNRIAVASVLATQLLSAHSPGSSRETARSSGARLAFTGFDAVELVVLALMLVTAGSVLVAQTRVARPIARPAIGAAAAAIVPPPPVYEVARLRAAPPPPPRAVVQRINIVSPLAPRARYSLAA